MSRPPDQPTVVHEIDSKLQTGQTSIHILYPSTGATDCKTLLLLPVEPGDGTAWGDPMAEVVKHDLHNKHSLVCVMPTFTGMPWYVDHPDEQHSQQERYLVEDVMSALAAACPDVSNADHLLVGFSKSGYGALNMVLRHPALFSKAAAWDAPLGMTSFSRYGAAESFGTQQNFDQYSFWDALPDAKEVLGERTRIGLFGYASFRGHVQAAHFRMLKYGIPHHYADGPRRKHTWDSGWLPEAVEFLVASS